MIARPYRSNTYDGSTMNICTETNRIATPNTMVIGGNLYEIIKPFPSFLEDYLCKLAGEHSVGDLERAYPVYSVASKYAQFRQDQLMNDTTSPNKSKGEVSLIRNSNHSSNILIVDDDSDILLTYQTFLEVEGYNVGSELHELCHYHVSAFLDSIFLLGHLR
jgi:hypothetical protein